MRIKYTGNITHVNQLLSDNLSIAVNTSEIPSKIEIILTLDVKSIPLSDDIVVNIIEIDNDIKIAIAGIISNGTELDVLELFFDIEMVTYVSTRLNVMNFIVKKTICLKALESGIIKSNNISYSY